MNHAEDSLKKIAKRTWMKKQIHSKVLCEQTNLNQILEESEILSQEEQKTNTLTRGFMQVPLKILRNIAAEFLDKAVELNCREPVNARFARYQQLCAARRPGQAGVSSTDNLLKKPFKEVLEGLSTSPTTNNVIRYDHLLQIVLAGYRIESMMLEILWAGLQTRTYNMLAIPESERKRKLPKIVRMSAFVRRMALGHRGLVRITSDEEWRRVEFVTFLVAFINPSQEDICKGYHEAAALIDTNIQRIKELFDGLNEMFTPELRSSFANAQRLTTTDAETGEIDVRTSTDAEWGGGIESAEGGFQREDEDGDEGLQVLDLEEDEDFELTRPGSQLIMDYHMKAQEDVLYVQTAEAKPEKSSKKKPEMARLKGRGGEVKIGNEEVCEEVKFWRTVAITNNPYT
ncbi:hypothetical protein HK102_008838 [Quaeritorhiza haematococci]|nr:hypothetical protein HK102_008838 [Quaeritorhiza haematococci]